MLEVYKQEGKKREKEEHTEEQRRVHRGTKESTQRDKGEYTEGQRRVQRGTKKSTISKKKVALLKFLLAA